MSIITTASHTSSTDHANALGLALHTSSPDLGLAIGRPQENPRIQVWDLGRDLSALLHLKLTEFMVDIPWTSLDFIAVAHGPGSFTSTRMGVVTARTLAQQLKIPLFGISSLAAIAAELTTNAKTDAKSQQNPPIALQLPAQRGEFHVGVYSPGSRFPLEPIASTSMGNDRVMTMEQWTNYQAQFSFQPQLIEVDNNQGKWVEQVLQLAQAAFLAGDRPHWTNTVPTYGQHPIQG